MPHFQHNPHASWGKAVKASQAQITVIVLLKLEDLFILPKPNNSCHFKEDIL